MKTHNAWCVGLLRYFLYAIRWVSSDLRQFDRSTRKILRQTKSHHCHASIERLYLPRQEGGRGLTNLEHMWERETVAAARYLHLSQDPQVIEALCLQRSQTLRANQTSRANSQARTLGQTNSGSICLDCPMNIVVAAQDGVTITRAYRVGVLKEDIPAICRHCGAERETLGHMLAVCESHKFSLYKERHDRVLYQLARALVQSLGESMPECLRRRGGTCGSMVVVVGSARNRILIDQVVPTLRQVTHRRPD